jgi:hypothetical protein
MFVDGTKTITYDTGVTEIWPQKDMRLQDAIDMCAKNLAGGIVHMNPGSMIIDDEPLHIWANVVLVGPDILTEIIGPDIPEEMIEAKRILRAWTEDT